MVGDFIRWELSKTGYYRGVALYTLVKRMSVCSRRNQDITKGSDGEM